jgi:sec-independent protein translocase protein TatC
MLRYWYEFRARVMRAAICYLLLWFVGAIFYQNFYQLLTEIWHSEVNQILLSDIRSGVLLPWRIAGAFALWLSVPYWAYEFVLFVSPALYVNERQHFMLIAVFATLLFMLGSSIGLWMVVPVLLSFAKQFLPQGLVFLPNMDAMMSLSLQVALIAGLVFEAPLLIYIMLSSGWITVEWLRYNRGYWVSGIFFVSMVLTPPDVISQLTMALPLWFAIEVTIVFYVWSKAKMKEILD